MDIVELFDAYAIEWLRQNLAVIEVEELELEEIELLALDDECRDYVLG